MKYGLLWIKEKQQQQKKFQLRLTAFPHPLPCPLHFSHFPGQTPAAPDSTAVKKLGSEFLWSCCANKRESKNHSSAEEDKEKNWVLFWVHHIVNTISTDVTFGRFPWFTLRHFSPFTSSLEDTSSLLTIRETSWDYYNMSVLMLYFFKLFMQL